MPGGAELREPDDDDGVPDVDGGVRVPADGVHGLPVPVEQADLPAGREREPDVRGPVRPGDVHGAAALRRADGAVRGLHGARVPDGAGVRGADVRGGPVLRAELSDG